MRLSRVTFSILFLCWISALYAQSYPVFIIVDELAEDFEQLSAELDNHAHVLFTTGFSPNAIEQFSAAADHLQIEELHIYTATKPGAIVFNSFAITTNSIPEISPALKEWSSVVKGQVVIHSEVVFTEEEGLLLKQQLEEVTGLVFSTQN